MVGPVLLMVGLSRISGATASGEPRPIVTLQPGPAAATPKRDPEGEQNHAASQIKQRSKHRGVHIGEQLLRNRRAGAEQQRCSQSGRYSSTPASLVRAIQSHCPVRLSCEK